MIFTGPADTVEATAKNAVVIAPGVFDRSPCGTGTSARMAQLFARKQLALQQDFVHESITDSLFTGRLIEQVRLTPEMIAVIPTIEDAPGLLASRVLYWTLKIHFLPDLSCWDPIYRIQRNSLLLRHRTVKNQKII